MDGRLTPAPVEVVPAHGPPLVARVKELFLEYAGSLGFRDIPPYTHNPIPGALFFELSLDSLPAGETPEGSRA